MLDIMVMVWPVGRALGRNKDASQSIVIPGGELTLDALFTLFLQVL